MKKRILILISSLKFGGVEKAVSDLTRYLIKNYEILITTFYDTIKLYPFKGKHIPLTDDLEKLKIPFMPLKLYKLIREFSPDILISFMDHTNIFAILTKAFLRIKIPLIISTRTNPILSYKNKKIRNYLIRLLYRLNISNKIVSVSNGLKDILTSFYGVKNEKIVTIYNGVEFDEIEKLQTHEIKDYKEIFNDKNIIKYISVGRLHEAKGHRYLIEAFSKVKDELSNIKLFIIGDGSLREDLNTLIKKKHLENDIYLLGFKRNPYKYISNSDIFVLPSIRESFGRVIIEAFACEKPVIATGCLGPNEILQNGEYGLITKRMDVNSLADKMILMAKDKNLQMDFISKAKKRMESFDFRNMINLWIDLIETYVN